MKRNESTWRDVPPWEVPEGRKKRGGLWVILAVAGGLTLFLVLTAVLFSVSLDRSTQWSYGWQDNDGVSWDSGEESELPRAPVGTMLTIPLNGREGLEPLSYEEIYARNVNAVVAVYGDIGSSVSMGTGVVLTEDGYIVTNEHVINGSSQCTIVLESGDSYDARLVGADAISDLAVLKVEASGLTAAEFGDSDLLVVGEEALAIGNPLGYMLTGTLTNGIVSAIDRDVQVGGNTMSLIQTTAALNEGNSGGALINIYGQVVGITNSKMMSSTTTLEGLGFAIPSATVQDVVEQLTQYGYVSTHLLLGITGYSTNGEAGQPEGVCVYSVTSGSDAEAQDLRPGDVITACNGQSVTSVDELNDLKRGLRAGDQLTLSVWRQGETFEAQVALAEP